VVDKLIMPRRPLGEQVFAHPGWGAVVVSFDQPVLVVGAADAADRLPQFLERLEAVDPEHLFLERRIACSAQPFVSSS
jgi:hypothetical protein